MTCCGCDSYLDWSDDSTVWSSSHKDELPWSCCAEEEQKTSDNFTFCPMPSDSSTDSPIPKHLQASIQLKCILFLLVLSPCDNDKFEKRKFHGSFNGLNGLISNLSRSM